MAWRLDGTYFETCSCDTVCPCTWSGFTAKATLERCRALLAYHVESGDIEGVDLSGLTFAYFIASPAGMAEGNWRVGGYLDAAASDEQAAKLGTVLSGQAGGPPAMLGPLISEILGVERARIDYGEDGRGHKIAIGDVASVAVEDWVAGEGPEPVPLTDVTQPSNPTLTGAPTQLAERTTARI